MNKSIYILEVSRKSNFHTMSSWSGNAESTSSQWIKQHLDQVNQCIATPDLIK